MEDVFDEREKGYEAKYKLDQERLFKARSRRDKLIGLWAAERMAMDAGAAAAYAGEMVVAGMGGGGEETLIARLLDDLAEGSPGIGEAEVRAEMARLFETAKEQIAEEYPKPLDSDHGRVGG